MELGVGKRPVGEIQEHNQIQWIILGLSESFWDEISQKMWKPRVTPNLWEPNLHIERGCFICFVYEMWLESIGMDSITTH